MHLLKVLRQIDGHGGCHRVFLQSFVAEAFHLQRYIPQSAVVPFSVRRSRVADESFRVFEFPENGRSQPLPQPDVVVESSLEPQRTDSGQQHVLSTFSNRGNFGCTMSAPTRVFACNVTLSRKDVIPGTRPTWTNIGANTNKSVARNFLLEKIFALSLRCRLTKPRKNVMTTIVQLKKLSMPCRK